MSEGNYWIDNYGMRELAFVEGIKAGLTVYAHWEDGIQYVGTAGKTLAEALKEVDEAFETEKEN